MPVSTGWDRASVSSRGYLAAPPGCAGLIHDRRPRDRRRHPRAVASARSVHRGGSRPGHWCTPGCPRCSAGLVRGNAAVLQLAPEEPAGRGRQRRSTSARAAASRARIRRIRRSHPTVSPARADLARPADPVRVKRRAGSGGEAEDQDGGGCRVSGSAFGCDGEAYPVAGGKAGGDRWAGHAVMGGGEDSC